MVHYKSVLVTNNTQSCHVIIYFYHNADPFCWISSSSKLLSPGSSHLHRCEDGFQFKIQSMENKCKKILVDTRKWERDTLFTISRSSNTIKHVVTESELEDSALEKTLCIRKLNVSKETSLDEGRNLYEILKLDFNEIRKLDKDKQDTEIKNAFKREIRRWHSDIVGELGDDEMAHEVIAAYEILRHHEKRAAYHNKADYTEGWLSTARWRSIFWPECETKEQIWRYRKRMTLFTVSLVVGFGGLISGILGSACLGGFLQSTFRTVNRKSIENGCDIKDWAKSFGIGFINGGLIAAIDIAAVEVEGQVMVTFLDCVQGTVFSLAVDAEKKWVDGEDVTFSQVIWHATAGAIINGAASLAVKTVSGGFAPGISAEVSSTNTRRKLRLRMGYISLQKSVKHDFTKNAVVKSVLGGVAGKLTHRLMNRFNKTLKKSVKYVFTNKGVKSVLWRVAGQLPQRLRRCDIHVSVRKAVKIAFTKSGVQPALLGVEGRLVPCLMGKFGESMEEFVKPALTNNSVQCVLAVVLGFIEERYDDKQDNRPGIEHFNDRRNQFLRNVSKELCSEILTTSFNHVKNKDSNDSVSYVDKLDKRSLSETVYGSSEQACLSLSVDSSCSHRSTHSASSKRRIHSASSDNEFHSTNSYTRTPSVHFERGVHCVVSCRCNKFIYTCSHNVSGSNSDNNSTDSCEMCMLKGTTYKGKAQYNPTEQSTEMTYVPKLSASPLQFEYAPATSGRFRYLPNKWFLKMIVEFKINGIVKVEKTSMGESVIKVPMDAKDVTVYFQVMRFMKKWCDLKKWNRFEKKWFDEPHKFKYETPPEQRVFTLGGLFFYEGVINVTDERHDDVKDM